MNRLLAVLADLPVDPDASTAQGWARDELANPIYHQGPSLISRLLQWIQDHLHGVADAGAATGLGWYIVAGILLVLVAAAFIVAGPVRRHRHLRDAEPGAVLDDDSRSADQLRADATAAAARGEWARAAADWFRAVVRGLEERTVLDERPGRTADEAARSAGHRLPALVADLEAGARLFDDVVYGGRPAGEQEADRMRALELAVRTARPASLVEADL